MMFAALGARVLTGVGTAMHLLPRFGEVCPECRERVKLLWLHTLIDHAEPR